jgi:multicomponent Na+:H+ antiporter subunit D
VPLDVLAPLCVGLPMAVGALLALLERWLPAAVSATAAMLTGVAVTVLGVLLLRESAHSPEVAWMGGWHPVRGTSVGIVLVVDPFAAGLVTLAGTLATAGFVFAWRFHEGPETLSFTLLLVFLAGLCGFGLSGDLFDMFVFFELMSVAAYALTGWKTAEPQSVQGALTFGVTNSLGAYVTLAGIALVYGRTGELGLAQAGVHLRAEGHSGFAVAAFTLICTGFLVKAAAVPFHFWLADAHAVAPTPVCVLFSGIMVEMGAYAVVRVRYACFGAAIPDADLHRMLIVLGTVTALVGSVMCLMQSHLKRMLAFSTMSHMGLILVALSLPGPDGVAGAAWYVVGHGTVKGALFLIAGVLLNKFETMDEGDLHGRGRGMLVSATVFLLGGVALAGVPPFALASGKDVVEDAARAAGLPWVSLLFLVVGACTGAAVLRAGLHVFVGLGEPGQEPGAGGTAGGVREHEEEPESGSAEGPIPWTMVAPAVVLLAASAVAGLLPGAGRALGSAAGTFIDTAGYSRRVLPSVDPHAPAVPVAEPVHAWSASGIALSMLALTLAIAFTAAAVRQRGWQGGGGTAAALRVPLHGLRRLHSGHLGDYAAMLALGVTVVLALLAA